MYPLLIICPWVLLYAGILQLFSVQYYSYVYLRFRKVLILSSVHWLFPLFFNVAATSRPLPHFIVLPKNVFTSSEQLFCTFCKMYLIFDGSINHFWFNMSKLALNCVDGWIASVRETAALVGTLSMTIQHVVWMQNTAVHCNLNQSVVFSVHCRLGDTKDEEAVCWNKKWPPRDLMLFCGILAENCRALQGQVWNFNVAEKHRWVSVTGLAQMVDVENDI